MTRRDLTIGALCLLAGWAASRAVIPRPEVALLSPKLSCEGATHYAATVDFAENARWAIQSGPAFWRPDTKVWSQWPAWQKVPGRIETGATTEPIVFVVQGFGSANQVTGVKVEGLK